MRNPVFNKAIDIRRNIKPFLTLGLLLTCVFYVTSAFADDNGGQPVVNKQIQNRVTTTETDHSSQSTYDYYCGLAEVYSNGRCSDDNVTVIGIRGWNYNGKDNAEDYIVNDNPLDRWRIADDTIIVLYKENGSSYAYKYKATVDPRSFGEDNAYYAHLKAGRVYSYKETQVNFGGYMGFGMSGSNSIYNKSNNQGQALSDVYKKLYGEVDKTGTYIVKNIKYQSGNSVEVERYDRKGHVLPQNRNMYNGVTRNNLNATDIMLHATPNDDPDENDTGWSIGCQVILNSVGGSTVQYIPGRKNPKKVYIDGDVPEDARANNSFVDFRTRIVDHLTSSDKKFNYILLDGWAIAGYGSEAEAIEKTKSGVVLPNGQ